MTFLKKAYLRASDIPGFHFGELVCLMLLSFFMGMALSGYDAASVRLYFEHVPLPVMGYDFIYIAFLWFFIGYQRSILTRQKGYGAIKILSAVVFLNTLVLIGMETLNQNLFAHVLFVSKYLVFSFFTMALFLIVSRFLPFRRESLKRLFIMGALFLGFMFGGFIPLIFKWGAYSVLYVSFFLLLGCYFSLFILSKIVSVPKELFVTKTGAAKNLSELKLVRTVLLGSFFVFAVKCLSDFLFYQSVAKEFELIETWQYLLSWWGLLGFFGILCVVILYRTRYFYMITGGIVLFLIGAFCISLGSLYQFVYLTIIGMILSSLALFLYFEDFILALLRLLNQGIGQNINRKRWMLIEPAGFLAGALLSVHFANQAWILFYLTAGLLVLFFLSLKFYSSLLVSLLSLRVWRGGPLLLLDGPVLDYIQKNIVSENKNDAIYFLRILEVSNRWIYTVWLLKSLKNKNEKVRLYVLEKMSALYNLSRYEKTIELIFLRDASLKVRCRALSLLIQIAYENKGLNGVNAYLPYLDNKKLKVGAMCGFLKTGGAPALLVADGLQELVNSKKIKDNLLALAIIDWAPSVGLMRQLTRLMKSTTPIVASKSLLVAAKIDHPECLPLILNSLDDMALRENALVALKSYGVKALPMIERALNNPETPAIRLKTLILFLSMLPSGEGKQVLLRSLQIGNQKLRKTIIQGMIDSGIFWTHHDKYDLLFNGIQKDVNRILWLTELMLKYKQVSFPQTSEVFSFLIRAIQEDLKETRETILYQLLLLKDNQLYIKAVKLLLSKRKDAYDLAMSSLQDMLPRKLFRLVKIALVDTTKTEKSVIQSDITIESATKDVLLLLNEPPFMLPDWIKATALYVLRMLDCPLALETVKKYLKSKNPLVLEAAIWAFCKLEKDEEKRHQTLIGLPTSQLLLQSLDTILES
ncbi:MAG: HEAT repeat domain-containing protein [Alphaproteobacteria bacterium]|nr:HEAT repeat domain-containing protein [Alphaproteobacteria bacterium]